MAYTNRWSITFKDIEDATHTIYIQQDGWDGGVTALIPGKTPIIWDEDSSEDLTKRVRGKTGHIEVIEENYGDLKDLYPTAPMQNRVVCNNVFWGYIKAQNSTNAWEAGPRVLKLNILSPLAMAYDIPMPVNMTPGLREMGSVILDIMDTIGYATIIMGCGIMPQSQKGEFFRGQINNTLICPYANDKNYHYANDNEVFAPISIGEVIEYICERHDLIAHDYINGDKPELILSKMNYAGVYYRWLKGNIIAGGSAYDMASWVNNGDTLKELLAEFTVADNNNTEQLIMPYSTIDVTHEGERGGNIEAPTQQSQYVEQQVAYYTLLPRGIWLSNANQCVRLHGDELKKVGNEGHNYDDWEMADVLDVQPASTLASGSIMFSITFYNVDPKNAYQLFFKYSHEKEGSHDSIYLSARGKSGWFKFSNAAEDVRPINEYPTHSTEQKVNISLGGGTLGEMTYEKTFRCGLVPDEYITLNFYVGAQNLQRLKIYDIHFEAYPSDSSGLTDRYAEQRFVERYPPRSTGEKKILQYNLHLNETFFSNYYHTDFEYNTEIPYYLINSQRRIRVTVKNPSMSSLWYLYKYYIESQDSIWKLVAMSYDVRNNQFTLTLHNNREF